MGRASGLAVSVLVALDRALFEPVLGVLDLVRARVLRWSAPVSRTFVRDRDARVVAAALVSFGLALVATGFATGWLLLLGPLLFGMPHLVAEARYLFFQRHRGNLPLLAVLAVQTVCAFAGIGVLALGPCCALALVVVTRERRRIESANPKRDRALSDLPSHPCPTSTLDRPLSALQTPSPPTSTLDRPLSDLQTPSSSTSTLDRPLADLQPPSSTTSTLDRSLSDLRTPSSSTSTLHRPLSELRRSCSRRETSAASRWTLPILAGAALMLFAAIVAPTWSRFALLHGHNLVPLVVWLAWRDRPRAVSAMVAGAIAACIGAILFGVFDGLAVRTPLSDEAFSLTRLTDAVAGEFAGPWRRRCLMLFAFTQAVHYAIWLRLVPEDARERTTPRSWRASWRAIQRDAGPTLARLAVLAIVAVPLFAILLGPVRARSFYVVASEFHATVEAVLVVLLFRARQPVELDDAPVSLDPPSLDVSGAGTHKPQSDVVSNSWYSQTVPASAHGTSYLQIGTHTSTQHPSPRSH